MGKDEFIYKGKKYLLTENREVGSNKTHSFISIFELTAKEDYEELKFINYFAYSEESIEELIEIAKGYIE